MKSNLLEITGKIFKSDFSKNVLTLVTGTSVAQLIPLLAAPVLSRIYTPEDFGLLALYLSVAQVLGSIANGRYELAIIIPDNEKDAIRLTVLAIGISVVLSLFVLVVVFFGGSYFAIVLGDDRISSWIYFLPFSVLMIGSFNALTYYSIRNKNFKDVAKANAFKSMGGTSVQLTLGLINFAKTGGLIIGQVTSHTFGNFKMLSYFWKEKVIILGTKKEELKVLAKRYKNFPKFSVWGIFINTLSQNMPNIFIARIFGLSDAGFYSHAYKYLGLPLNLIGNSIAQVFLQELSDKKGDLSVSKSIYLSTLKKLLFIGLLIFIPAFFLIEYLYEIIFGPTWKIAGMYAKFLIPLVFARFVAGPLTMTATVYEKQKVGLSVNLLLLFIILMVFTVTYLRGFEVFFFIQALSFFVSLFYIVLIIIYYRIILTDKIFKA